MSSSIEFSEADELGDCDEERDSFLHPTFTLRKRRKKDDDTISISSLDQEQELPKRKKSLNKMASLSNVSAALSKVGKRCSALQKSISSSRFGSPVGMRAPSTASLARSASNVFGDTAISGRQSPGSQSLQESQGPVGWASSPFRKSSVSLGGRKTSATNLTPYKAPVPTPSKNRPTRYWAEVYSSVLNKLSSQEAKLQEAVYEIFIGEEDLVDDLKLIRKTYADSLIHLNILTPAEESLVFGRMSSLLPLHQMFYDGLKRQQCKDGFWFEIGASVDKWVNSIEDAYVNYCSNLIETKSFLDKKQTEDKNFSDFLQRCIESPFSRKLELWSFLDVPRSRLVKYPLLFKQVLKYSGDQDDIRILTECISKLESIISTVDKSMAKAKCMKSISSMEFMTPSPPECVLTASEEVMCGVLRNGRGTKVVVFLLDTALVVGRQVSRPGGAKVTQVTRDPFPTSCLVCTDLQDPSVSQDSGQRPGSFHRTFTNGNPSKNSFRLTNGDDFDSENNSRSVTLTAPDEHAKKQWIGAISKAIAKSKERPAMPSKPMSVVDSKARVRTSPRLLNKKFSKQFSNIATSSPKLLSASKLISTPKIRSSSTMKLISMISPTKTSSLRKKMFAEKNSLSNSALEKVQSGGVKKIRSKPKRNDENQFRGGLAEVQAALHMTNGYSSKSLSKLQTGTKSRRMLQILEESNGKCTTGSLEHLKVENELSSPRYTTRSTKKLSKSMNDLLMA